MSKPRDTSKLPGWWTPCITRSRSLYEVVGLSYSGARKTLNIIALDEIFAAKTAKDQFQISDIESVTLKVRVVWAPERL